MVLQLADSRLSSVALEEDFDSSTNPEPGPVLEAEVILGTSLRYEINAEVDEEGHRPTNSGKDQEEKGRRNSIDPLFATLYTALTCAIIFLAVALTRYILFKRSLSPPPPSSPPTILENAATPDIVNDSATQIELIPDKNPIIEKDPIAYRTNIEFILSVELHEECSRTFFQGPQKMAIDWLVYEDQVLNATHISEMAESRGINGNETGEPISAVPLVQRYAVMVLFFGTGGELWSGQSWINLVDIPECMFDGLRCLSNGEIGAVVMPDRKLRGRLPEEFGMLTALKILVLKKNRLEGSIPWFMYNRLTDIRDLDLSQNKFSSSISSDISNLPSLRSLYLSELALTGEIPIDAMKSLSGLRAISVASATSMTGPLFELLPFWPLMSDIDMHTSGMTGTIPTTIGGNTELESVRMDGVSMDFSNIPTEIGLLTKLKTFNVRPSLEGLGGATIPTEIGNCTNLQTLWLGELSGSIPTVLGHLTSLTSLWLTGGTLTGTLPTEMGELTKLTSLNLKQNQLEGTLPSEIGKLQELSLFGVQSSGFTGSIPSGVCKSPSISTILRDCNIEECECCSATCYG